MIAAYLLLNFPNTSGKTLVTVKIVEETRLHVIDKPVNDFLHVSQYLGVSILKDEKKSVKITNEFKVKCVPF